MKRPTKREWLAQEITSQRRWVADHGGSLQGYVDHYGSRDGEHYGDGGEAIYEADINQLKKLEAQWERLVGKSFPAEVIQTDAIKLSRMDCYAGKIRAEVLPWENDGLDRVPGLYLQFVQGCGYSPYEMTPDEADQLAALLRVGAAKARANFKK